MKTRTAFLMILANLGLTLLKFLAFFVSGSLAVLAESWHSLSDVATSVAVYLAFKQDESKQASDEIPAFTFEEIISLGIGLILFCVSISIFQEFSSAEERRIENAFFVGTLFLGFAFCSRLIARYELKIGQTEGSVGLISDSKHTEADMLSSLAVGLSLIACEFGLNIDRFMGLFIALIILALAIEVVWNAIYSRKARYHAFMTGSQLKQELTLQFKTHQILVALGAYLHPQKILGPEISAWIKLFFMRNQRLLAGFLILLWLGSGLVQIQPGQSGIVSRFGSSSPNLLEPGLHLLWPLPFETVIRIDTEMIRTLDIGNLVQEKKALIWAKEHGEELPFLSGDNNFLYPYLRIYYRVTNPLTYLNLSFDSHQILHQLSLASLTSYFASQSFYALLAEGRQNLGLSLKKQLQAKLDDLGLGILILEISLRDIHPPITIARTFEDVVASMQDKQTETLRSVAYFNQSIPSGRGLANQTLEESKVYALEKISRANRETRAFTAIGPEFEKTSAIQRLRLSLEAAKEGLKDRPLVVFGSGVDPDRIILQSSLSSIVPLTTKDAP